MKTYYKNSGLFLMIVLFISACKNFTDVSAPSDQLNTQTVFTNDVTVRSAVEGLYSTMANSNSDGLQLGLTAFTDMCADNMNFPGGIDYDQFINNSIPVSDASVANIWAEFYASIYQANNIISGIQSSPAGVLTDSIKKDAVAESKFIRAFCYFYLTNLWGDVPLALTSDAKTNNSLLRSSQSDVYKQVVEDLTEAKNTLRPDYAFSGGERIRANKYSAMALLSRVYLYNKDWKNAELYADSVLSQTSLFGLLDPSEMSGIFTNNNKEAIFQLQAFNKAGYTNEGQYFLLINNFIPLYALTDNLVNSFDPGDNRLKYWIGTSVGNGASWYYPLKYKKGNGNTTVPDEYVTYIRLAELYLIRAEARNAQGDIGGALADINKIRERAGLKDFVSSDTGAVETEIEKENRLEFFAEYGHRWLDLKRWNRADAVLNAYKSGWKSSAALWPIPLGEIKIDHQLTQNPGYGQN